MATRTIIYTPLLAAGLAGAALFAYSVYATQGSGTLAQAPMNIQANIKPAFIMAVDDSGSMSFQVLMGGFDGAACWSGDSFYSGTTPNDVNKSGCSESASSYWYVIPSDGYRVSRAGRAIPPVDGLGFARSAEVNRSYFDPHVAYEPWLNGDGTAYTHSDTDSDGNASPVAARVDPRSNNPKFDLTSLVKESASSYRFELRKGMVLPKGMQYYTTSSCGGMGSNSSLRNKWIELTAPLTVSATCTVGLSYFPAVFYLPTGAAAPGGYIDTVVAPDGANRVLGGRAKAVGACGQGCDMYRYEIRPNNYSDPAAYQAAIRNFANWFSYYGNRNLAMVAAMTRSMIDVRDMRVGYFAINDVSGEDPKVQMRDMTVQADKVALFGDLHGLVASGGTPNLKAVNHIGKQFMRTDEGAPIVNQCQKNSGMLFTDGYSNAGSPGADAITGLGIPFDPTPKDSLAAIATKYYQATLRTGAGFPTGKVRVPEACSTLPPGSIEWKRLDCNTNLHMNLYGITLGARGVLFNPDLNRDPYTDASIYGHWPSHSNDNPSTVDDLWHATVNTRGEYINASSPVEITTAMRRVLASAGGGSTPSGSLGLTGARIGDGSFTVTPSYTARNESTDWHSNLLAQTVTSNVLTGEATFTKLWEATDPGKIPIHGSRNIYRAKNQATGVKPKVQPFDTSNVTLDDFCVSSDPLARCSKSGSTNGISGSSSRLKLNLVDIVNYLRGDQSAEVQNNGKLRDRTTRLGDIVNSTPVVVSPYTDHGYRSLRTVSGVGSYAYPFISSYETFLAAKKTADKPVVFAGANDGMLHAFDGKTGTELFGFIPATALGHMGNLLFPYASADKENQVFSHTFYVDGPVTVSDAYLGSDWKTVLVGTAGAGGRGVFGLDVTTPGSFAGGNVLWEINDKVSDADIKGDIGHVLGKPVIVPVINGATTSWKAIFGNGYNSNRQDAVLFVVDIATGAVTRIKAEESSRASVANGLGNIVVLDRWIGDAKGSGQQTGGDGFADTVYAADQNGAVWKFDLRDNSVPSDPFFVATDANSGGTRQPILGGLEAAAGPGGAVMLYFGTGSFSFDGDKTDTQLQSVYGVLDRGANVSRSELLQQTITEVSGERKLTDASIGSSPGWYINLAIGSARKGERVIGYPRVESGVVFITTYEPQSTADCAGDGFNRIYGVYALSGGSAMSSVRFGSPTGSSPGTGANGFVLETGGSAPVKDVAVLSTPRLQPLPVTATAAEQAAALAARCSMIVQVAGAPPMYMPRQCGRQSWRQVR